MNVTPELVATLAPTGSCALPSISAIRSSRITDPATGEPRGVSIDLAREFARRLGVDLELVVFDSAGKSVQAVTDEQADIFAIDPLRGAGIAFAAAYVLIEGSYLVREDSPLRDNNEVDQADRTVVVGNGSAYDLFLTRELKHATILRWRLRRPRSTFVEQRADVAAGVKQQLQADARRIGSPRLLQGRFMVIQQAMGTPKGRGTAAAACLAQFVEETKASGFVATSLARHGIQGASVAPPSNL
jgi:polar amino acid transport system substrate-binding protein